MNRGALAFRALSVADSVWCSRLGKKPVTIRAWRAGRRTPDTVTRRRIHEEFSGPAPDLWDELVATVPTRTHREPPPAEPATPAATEGEAAKLLAHVRQLQEELSSAAPEAFELPARVRMAAQLGETISRLGHITGTRVTMRQILASSHWSELEELIIRALESWPDAMRAVAEALDGARQKGTT